MTHAAPNPVAVVKGDDVESMVAQAVALSGGLGDLIRDGAKVVIKPNLTMLFDRAEQRLGAITDVRVVAMLVKMIRRTARCEITLAEGCAPPALEAFEFYGYGELAREYGLKMVELDGDARRTVDIDGIGLKQYPLPATVLDCDVFINVPVLKTHLLTGVTLGMKNLFGLMPKPRMPYHEIIAGVLCDIIRIRKPDLTVIDGLYGMEGLGPTDGVPVKMDLVMAGREIVAVDAVATAVMGFEPWRVEHLKCAADHGLGEIDPARIPLAGRRLDEVRRPFRPSCYETKLPWPRSEALVARILALADRVDTIWNGQGKRARFGPQHLRPEWSTHPLRQPQAFTVLIDDRANSLTFHIHYITLLPETIPAAVEQVRRWIQEKLPQA